MCVCTCGGGGVCVCVFVMDAPNIDVSSTLRAQLRKHTHRGHNYTTIQCKVIRIYGDLTIV